MDQMTKDIQSLKNKLIVLTNRTERHVKFRINKNKLTIVDTRNGHKVFKLERNSFFNKTRDKILASINEYLKSIDVKPVKKLKGTTIKKENDDYLLKKLYAIKCATKGDIEFKLFHNKVIVTDYRKSKRGARIEIVKYKLFRSNPYALLESINNIMTKHRRDVIRLYKKIEV